MTSRRDTIIQVVADVLGPAAGPLDGSSGLDLTPGLDSMQHLSVIMALEEEFGVRVAPEDLARNRTIRDLAALIGRLKD